MNYYNLQVHTCYDLLNSTIKIKNLFEKLQAYQQDSVIISDPNLYAAISAHKVAKQYHINLIHSLSLKLSFKLDFINLNLICKNKKMFQHLLKISSTIQTKKEEIRFEDFLLSLKEIKQDCIILVSSQIKNMQDASYIAAHLQEFTYYFAFNEHCDYHIYSQLKSLVYTKPAYYLEKDEYQSLIVARAIRDNQKLNITDLVSDYGDNFLHSSISIKEMLAKILNPMFREMIIKAIANQEKIIKTCQYDLEFSNYHLPKYQLNEDEKIYSKLSSNDYLKYLVIKGAKEKLIGKDISQYKKRFEYELAIINDMGFADYFLIVYDFVKFAKSNGIVVGPGRGSSAGSLVCYLLDITEADPLEFNLLFERFLNKERISMPDIDIDFQDTRRDEVIKYVENKYGVDKVAQIITFDTLKSKSAAGESARIFQFPSTDLKKISAMINSKKTLTECYEENSKLYEFVNANKQNMRWFKVALGLENLPRNKSVHAAGLIISDDNDINHYTPLETGNTTTYTTQWTGDDIEYVGLLKIDFLGIKYLTMIDDISKEIQKKDKQFDIKTISFSDKNVFNLFASGKTEGIFQFENPGLKQKLTELVPSRFNDIVAMTSLYRPGPMAYIPNYINRKHKREPISYPHPLLEAILKETYGVIVYQEQIILIAVRFAGMSLHQADNMRRAVSKKKKEDLEYYGNIFIAQAIKAGHHKTTAKTIFDMIVAFANYGFNKSHAVVYGMIAYRLAYLKVYYKKYFMNALLNNVISNETKINEYKLELSKNKITLLAPNINISQANFSIYKDNIIFALLSIKNVGTRAAREIVNDRNQFGNYQDMDDFLYRMNKKVDQQAATALAKAGAFDTFGYNRATIINKIKNYYEDNRDSIHKVRFSISSIGNLTLKTEEIEDFSIQEKIQMEKEVTGTYFLKHPAQLIKEKYHYLPLEYISNKSTSTYVEITSIREILTKKSDKMAFITVNDGIDEYSVTIFPNTYKFISSSLKVGNFFVMNLKHEKRNDKDQYILEKITSLENYLEFSLTHFKQIYVLVDKENTNFIKDYIDTNGKIKLVLFFANDKNKKQILNIKNEQNFVRNFIENFPNKSIKLVL